MTAVSIQMQHVSRIVWAVGSVPYPSRYLPANIRFRDHSASEGLLQCQCWSAEDPLDVLADQ